LSGGGNLTNEAEVKKFLDILYPNYTGGGHLVLWTKPDRQSKFFSMHELDQASQEAAALSQGVDVYFGVGVQAKIPEDNGRGKADTVVTIPGLWMDIDVKGDNHKSEQLPQTIEAASEFIESIKLKPTIIVSTGGGMHAYWLCNNPMAIRDPQSGAREMTKLEVMSKAVEHLLEDKVELEKQIEEMEPKVEELEQMTGSEDNMTQVYIVISRS